MLESALVAKTTCALQVIFANYHPVNNINKEHFSNHKNTFNNRIKISAVAIIISRMRCDLAIKNQNCDAMQLRLFAAGHESLSNKFDFDPKLAMVSGFFVFKYCDVTRDDRQLNSIYATCFTVGIYRSGFILLLQNSIDY